MNYHRIYEQLVDRARGRELVGYSEKHHIVPRCIGGSDEPGNLVAFTAREHYFAHQLLLKMHPNVVGLWFAAHCMSKKGIIGKYGSRNYEWVRRGFAKCQSVRLKGKPRDPAAIRGLVEAWHKPKSASHRAALSAANRGKTASEETRRKLSEAHKGRVASAETRAKLSKARLGKKTGLTNKSRTGMTNSAETRAKISAANRGKKHSDQWKLNISLGQASLPDEVIKGIRAAYEGSVKISEIARRFGLSRSHTSRIAKRESYGWVA